MIKKIFTVLALWMAVLCPVMAQNAVGDWRIYTSYVGDKVTAVADTRQWVYYLAGGNLFRLDKETQENESLNIINDLSDMTISKMYYNTDKNYVVVVYSNANIDIIKADGSVVNMPEIKDAVLTAKTINDVTFADGVIYVAADFGYVVIDDRKFVVKESNLYGERLVSVARVGDKLLVSTPTALYYGDAEAYHEQISSFTLGVRMDNGNKMQSGKIVPVNDSTFFYNTGWTYLVKMSLQEDGTFGFLYKTTFAENPATQVQKTTDGYMLNIPNEGIYITTDENGKLVKTVETPGEMCSSHPDANGIVWAAGAKGLHMKDSEYYYLPNALTMESPFWMTYNKSKDLLYVTSPAANGFFGDESPSVVNTFDGIMWRDVTPEGAPASGSYWVDFMPDNPDTYFLSTWRKGLLKVVNNEIVLTYDSENSPLSRYHPTTSFDRNGNLWVVQSLNNQEHPVMVLPAAKTKLNQVTKDDWITFKMDEATTGKTQRAIFLSTRYSSQDIKLYTDGDFEHSLIIWSSGSDVSSISKPEVFDRLTDQDGQSVTWTNIVCLEEDLSGIVWMGTTEGVVSFNPAQAFNSNFRVNHIKVPRNDGTGMADYLLDGIQVNGIAVDGANRKWIATNTSGLFLVSADGSKIIHKFNTTNSPLASNTVYKVCCNPNSNSVYATTPAGVYEYFSDSSPAEPNYSDIYAYPNPVRPDFGGDVTITGMMDNSLVKIADAGGNVIRQLKSTGGMATWDCCDQYGERVKTGVYFVLCSQANGGSESVVTKIAVIR